jgi:sugar (pentulose or hexulose) kinase
MATLIASIDCGSSLIKAGIIDLNGRLVCDASRETPCAYKNGGGVAGIKKYIKKANMLFSKYTRSWESTPETTPKTNWNPF